MKIDDAKVRTTLSEIRSLGLGSKRISIFNNDKRYEVTYISVENLVPYNKQARKLFDQEEIDQLAITIKEHGIRQPLTVLRSKQGELLFEVISGERRLRAAKLVGLTNVPCIIIEDLNKAEEIALIENVQRQDLHPIEVARALKSLVDKIGWGGQEELRSKVGLSSSQISELIKLNTLSPDVQNIILEKNFRGRDNLRKLYDMPSTEEQINFIKKNTEPFFQKNTKRVFSVLRFSFDEGNLKIQKNALAKLTASQKVIIKENLSKLINEIDESLQG